MPVVVAISAAVTVTLLVSATLTRREDVFRARLRSLAAFSEDEDRTDFSIPFLERVLYPLTDSLADRIISLLPPGLAQRMSNTLVQAGDPMKFRNFIGIWMVVFAAFGLGGAFLLAAAGMLAEPLGFLLLAVTLVIAAYLPYSFLSTAARRRKKLILKALPDAMDLITTSVEGGVGTRCRPL
jgi:tight adherence protein C